MLFEEHREFDAVIALEVIEHVADPSEFCKSLAALTVSDGATLISTINRSMRSYPTAIIAAEYILHWISEITVTPQIESWPQKKHPLRVVDDSNKGSARYFDYLFYIDFEASMAELHAQYALGHLQDVYMYFRGSGKAAEMKREAAKRTMMAALP
ncbi:unnamed protein product [Camellia sinensis]